MSATQAARWPISTEVDDLFAADVLHARARATDESALCEQGDAVLPFGAITMALDVARANPQTVIREVDCLGCLEWMHA